MRARSRVHGLAHGLTIAGLAGCGLLAALMGGPTSGPVAAVFPPWWDKLRTLDAAAQGGAVLRFGASNFVVLVAPDDLRGRARLWRAGAWLLLSPRGLAGCGADTRAKSHGE